MRTSDIEYCTVIGYRNPVCQGSLAIDRYGAKIRYLTIGHRERNASSYPVIISDWVV